MNLNNKDIALKEVDKNPFIVKRLNKELRNDKNIVTKAYFNNIYSIDKLESDLFKDRDFVYKLTKINGYILTKAEFDFSNDYELIESAIKTYGTIYKYANEEMRSDKFLAMKAASSNSKVYTFVMPNLYNDTHILLECLKTNGEEIKYFPYELRNDIFMSNYAVKSNVSAYKYLGNDLLDNMEILHIILENCFNYKIDLLKLRSSDEVRNLMLDNIDLCNNKEAYLAMAKAITNVNLASRLIDENPYVYMFLNTTLTGNIDLMKKCVSKLNLIDEDVLDLDNKEFLKIFKERNRFIYDAFIIKANILLDDNLYYKIYCDDNDNISDHQKYFNKKSNYNL